MSAFESNKVKLDNPAHYNQNHAFLYAVIAFSVVTLIKLDELVRAVGLRPIGFLGGSLCAYGLIIITIILAVRWGSLSRQVGLLLFIVVSLIAYFSFPEWLILTAWLLGIVNLIVPPIAFPLLIIATLFLWYWSNKRGKVYRRSTVLQNVMLTTLLCASYLIGNAGPRAEFSSIADIDAGEHHYYLNVDWGYVDAPDEIYLYECNSLAFACEAIYHGGIEENLRYAGNPDKPEIKLDISEDMIRVLVDGEVWFEQVRNEE